MITLGPKYLTSLGAQHLWALGALAWALVGVHDGWAAAELASLLLAYTLGTRIGDHHRVWVGYNCLVAALIAPAFFFHEINSTMVAYGAALGLAGAIGYNQWAFIATNLWAIILLPSRGAIAAAGVLGLACAWRWSKTACLLILCAACLAFAAKDGLGISLYQRMGIWQDTLNHLTFFGSGFGSFQSSYASWPIHRNIWDVAIWLAPHAYNDVLELLFELGIGSVLVWGMLAAALETASRQALLIILAFAVLSLTYFPLSIPLVGHMFLFTLGGAGARNRSPGYTADLAYPGVVNHPS